MVEDVLTREVKTTKADRKKVDDEGNVDER